MKSMRAIAIVTMLGFLVAGNALAQHNEVRANVPFSFTVGGHVLPAGNYAINSVSDNAIEIRSQGKPAAMLALAFSTVEQSKSGDVLVFERHGDLYSLREILCATRSMNVSLPAEHWKKGSYIEEAMNSPSDGLLLVRAN